MTVNMEIDQEMMAIATQDDDFSATLVGMKSPEELFDQHADDVETIIMEGEIVRGSIEKERHHHRYQLRIRRTMTETKMPTRITVPPRNWAGPGTSPITR